MSRYLRNIVARSSGAPLRALPPPSPHRWAVALIDPFAAAEAPAPGPDVATDIASLSSAAPLLPSRDAAGAAASAFHDPFSPAPPSGALAPDRSPVDRTAGSRGGPPSIDEASRSSAPRAAAGSDRLPARSDDAPARSGVVPSWPQASGEAARTPAVSPGASITEAASPARVLRSNAPSGAAVLSSGDDRSPTVIGSPHEAPTERRAALLAPVAALPGQRPSTDGNDARGASVLLAVPPTPRAAATPPARGTAIVIGRVSVVVEPARPPAPPQRPAARSASSSRPADDGPQLAHRFGLGQL